MSSEQKPIEQQLRDALESAQYGWKLATDAYQKELRRAEQMEKERNLAIDNRHRAEQERDDAREQLAHRIETNTRHNRRVQQAESAAAQNVAECKRQGVGLGRQLAAWSAHDSEKKLTAALAEVERLRGEHEKACEDARRELTDLSASARGLERMIGRLDEDRAKLAAELREAQAESASRYDCHGGPGTTEPSCGACVTCLQRELAELLQIAKQAARR